MSDLDRVPVLRGHLSDILRALTAALNYHEARQIAKAAENLGSHSNPTGLTRALSREVDRVTAYIEQEAEDDE